MPDISVVICTHNRRPEYWGQVLGGLRKQTLNPQLWELVVVDNLSDQPVSANDLVWHSNARVVREEKLGLTPARLRGIQEAVGNILFFVDDDNIVRPDYLEQSLAIARAHPSVGCWGGNISVKFDEPPPSWTQPYWGLLGVRSVTQDTISRDIKDGASTPYGAGICLRREVAAHYREVTMVSPIRQALGRRGNSLVSGEDVDIACTACDLGMAKGVFTALEVCQLIPPGRVTEPYLLKLAAAAEFSNWVLDWSRSQTTSLPKPRNGIKVVADFFRRFTRKGRFRLARLQGRAAARDFLILAQAEGTAETAATFVREADFKAAR